ncbi:MAG: tRNA preQ1(34) S-adenosylmethionine ribosyltransferase-isomerase QueA [Planctomycetes bacterium]|nr:tRNA preQ1(34) S-adenosylmethionine ribosyltransferase-isomerase QueA [Planctomycetota bacterium]
MFVSDFRFELPEEQIATQPVEPRDAARLLVYERAQDRLSHRRILDLPELLAPGDLLVLNDTKVLACRLLGRRASGARVEVLILDRDGPLCRGFVRPARKARTGERIPLEGGRLTMVPLADLGGGVLRFRLEAPAGRDLGAVLEEVGRAPLPPYIQRDGGEDPAADRARYQTTFARVPGAVAAPTAGLHFTPRLFEALAQRGVERAFVTLHVGEGTFAPVRVERVEDHAMHAEWFDLPEPVAAAVAGVRQRGARVVAVGSTSTRTLETCAVDGGLVEPRCGETALFLHPGRPIRVVDALLTNFHLPGSTLLMLVAAFLGRERTLAIYAEAVRAGYRFYSFGDAMLIL